MLLLRNEFCERILDWRWAKSIIYSTGHPESGAAWPLGRCETRLAPRGRDICGADADEFGGQEHKAGAAGRQTTNDKVDLSKHYRSHSIWGQVEKNIRKW